ncbi:hypothetical protein FACS189425_09040 [Clostridia bacterium]|nr:hypothetical protein FACS189425_09040 [Clostridia bacterium]
MTIFVLFSVIFLCTVFLAPFFKIARIDISGISPLTGTQVQGVCDTLVGKNINWYRLDKISETLAQFPYVHDAKVSRHFPNVLRVTITEREPMVQANISDLYFYIDDEGKILEVSPNPLPSAIELRGITDISVRSGGYFADVNSQVYKNYTELFKQLLQNNLIGSIIWVDLLDPLNMRFQLNGIAVQIGTTDKLDYKFTMLTDIRKQLPSKVKGTLDLTNGAKSYFKEIY